MPGARCTRSLAREVVVKNAHESSQRVRRISPAFPDANGLTAYGVLSPETNSSRLRRRRIDDAFDSCDPNGVPLDAVLHQGVKCIPRRDGHRDAESLRHNGAGLRS
jgi:hypothetical protein